MIGRPRVRTILLVCLGLVLAGAAADVWVLERPATTGDRLKDQTANLSLTQPQLEALGDRAQAELKVLVSAARSDTRDRIADLGAELEKLGRKVQELARTPAAKSEPAETGPNGTQPPVN